MLVHYLIPELPDDAMNELEHHITADTLSDAEDWFVESKDRLLDINNWCKYSPVFGDSFRLGDSHGKQVKRHAHRGDHIIIQLSTSEHSGVMIDAIEYDDYPDESRESIVMRLRHDTRPETYEYGKLPVFKSLEDGCILAVTRTGKQLSAFYHGRTEEMADGNDVQTTVLGSFGKTTAQWDDLIKGFIE